MDQEQLNIDQAGDQQSSLPNLLAVVKYLRERGWKISKSPAYRHKEDGKIRPQTDGAFLISDVEKYAKHFLKRNDGSTGGPSRKAVAAQSEKQAAEIKKAAAQARHWEIKTRIMEGQYVDRSEFERALASRAMLYRQDEENDIRSGAIEIIQLVDGDPEMVPDLIEFMLKRMEKRLGRYSKPGREFLIQEAN